MKKYIQPQTKTILLSSLTLMAGSYIEQGNTDGQGSGQIDASAKEATSLFNYDYDEEE